MGQSQESAETLGLRALAWLVGNDDLLQTFMGSSGVSEEDVRAGAADPAFLGAVLEFLLMNDAWVIECSDALNVPGTAIGEARGALPGGEQVHWT